MDTTVSLSLLRLVGIGPGHIQRSNEYIFQTAVIPEESSQFGECAL
jgi:hypothetical protein